MSVESVNKATVDDYRNRDVEERRQHEQQIKRLREEHDAALKKLRSENEANLKAFHNEAQEKLSKKDIQNQNKINEINRVYKDQMRKTAEDFERQSTQSKIRTDTTVDNLRDSKDEQINSLS